MIEKHFDSGAEVKTKVKYWTCSREEHHDGSKHDYLSMKLYHPKKWLLVKENILNSENILINFADHHSYYIAALIYISKNYNQK